MSSQPNIQRVFRQRLMTDRQPTPDNKPHSKYKNELLASEEMKAEAYNLIHSDKYAAPVQNKYINQSHIKYDFHPLEPQRIERQSNIGNKGRFEQRKILKNMLNEIDNAKKEYEEVKRSQEVVDSYFRNNTRNDESLAERSRLRQESADPQRQKVISSSDRINAPYYLANDSKHRRARSMTPGNKRISRTMERSIMESQVSFVDDEKYKLYYFFFFILLFF